MVKTAKAQAIICLRGHTAYACGVSVDVLDRVLTVNVIRHSTDEKGVLRLKRREMQLYGTADDLPKGEVFFPAGLAKRVFASLSRLGIRVQVIDQTRWLALEKARRNPAPDETDEARTQWYEIFRTLPRAQIIVRSRRRMVEAIGVCAQVYPKARILVICKNNHEARAITADLRKLIPERVRLFAAGISWCDFIVLVITSFHSVGEGNQQYDIAIFVGHETLISHIGQVEATKMSHHLRYCIRYPWRKDITPYEEWHVEASCGPVEFVERSTKVRALRVWFIHFGGVPGPGANTAAQRKRTAYWRNAERNRLICRAVQAIQQRDTTSLEEFGLTAANAARFVEHLPERVGVAIVVDSLEHARILHQRACPREINFGQEEAEWCSRRLVCDVSLITAAFADRVPIIAHVILRATGGTAELTLRQGSGLDRNEDPQIVVDVWDEFDQVGSAKRADDYRKHGAEVIVPKLSRNQAAQTKRERKS